MRKLSLLGLALAVAVCLRAEPPIYSAVNVVNAASNTPVLAPNSVASIYGKNLSYETRGLLTDDIRAGFLPIELGRVQVWVNNYPAPMYYVSPGQLNFVIPASLLPGRAKLRVVREGTAGPLVEFTLAESAPALFAQGAELAVATHVDGSVITPDLPALPGEVVVLYATGMGRTDPRVGDGELAVWPSRVKSRVQVLLNGNSVPEILYSGVAPGFSGLYQVNFRMLDVFEGNPEIRLGVADQMSPQGLKLPAQSAR